MLPRLNLNSLQISPRGESPLALTSGSGSLATEKKELRSRVLYLGATSPNSLVILTKASPTLVLICLHLSLPNQCKLTSEYFQHLVWRVPGDDDKAANARKVKISIRVLQVGLEQQAHLIQVLQGLGVFVLQQTGERNKTMALYWNKWV